MLTREAQANPMALLRRAITWADQDGQALVEYSFILCLVVVVCIVVVMVLGNQVLNMYCNISGSFHN
jgi:Flp pilus assembly pilin Flp